MAFGDASEQIRTRAWERYIEPLVREGKVEIAVPIKRLMKEMEAEDFPPNHPRQFCKALQKRTFLREKGLVLEYVEGPPSGTSTTVVLHFRTLPRDPAGSSSPPDPKSPEAPAERAFRLTEKLRGLMKDQIAAHGGTEGFMRWVRSDEDETAG
jgi:hypothetical protein